MADVIAVPDTVEVEENGVELRAKAQAPLFVPSEGGQHECGAEARLPNVRQPTPL